MDQLIKSVRSRSLAQNRAAEITRGRRMEARSCRTSSETVRGLCTQAFSIEMRRQRRNGFAGRLATRF
jgi:hypothetical protein